MSSTTAASTCSNETPKETWPRSPAISWPSVVAYALSAAPLGFMMTISGVYLLKFASDVLLVAPALFSILFAASKVFDAISDPVAGYASDRTRLALGRRRPWILAAVLPMCATFWAVWSPPTSIGPAAIGAWLGIALVLYHFSHTIASVPHLALGAELSLDHHERTRIFGTRAAFEFVGIGAAAGSMAWLQTSDDPRGAALAITLLFAFATLLLLPISALRTPERREYQTRPTPPPLRALRDVVANSHARILLGALIIDAMSFNLMGALFPFIAAYVLPDDWGPSSGFIVAAIACAILMFPIWPLLARRVGKRNAWLIALAMRMVGLACVLPGWNFAPLQMLALVLVGGSLSCTFIIPPSIQSDAIDHDELLTHDRKEGSYFATWNFAQKLAAAAAIAIAGVVLQASGYTPGAEQSEATRNALRLFFIGVPFLLHGIAFACLLRLRLDATEHARIRRELDQRRHEDPPIPTARRQNPLSRPDGAQ